MDKLTLSPDESGYSFKDGVEVLRAQLSSGRGRFTRGILNAAIPLNVQWTCDADEYDYLMAAYDTHVAEGHAPFPIDLIIDDTEFVEHQVRIMPGTFGLSGHAGDQFVVKAVLEVQPTPKQVFEETIPKFTLPPDKDGYTFMREAQAIHQPLDGGMGRVYRDQVGVSTKVNVRWTTGLAGFLYIRNFYRDWVTKPDSFPMDLIIDTAAPLEYNVWFIPGSLGLDSISGHTFTLSAQIEVDTDEELGEPPATFGIYLDTFTITGEGSIPLSTHTPDIAPSGFAYAEPMFGDELQVEPATDTLRTPDTSVVQSANEGWTLGLADYWRIELDVSADNSNSEYAPYAQFVVNGAIGQGIQVRTTFYATGNEGSSVGMLEIMISYGESSWYTTLPNYDTGVAHEVVLHGDIYGVYITVDGEFGGALYGALEFFAAVEALRFEFNAVSSSDAIVHRAAIYGEDEGGPIDANVIEMNTENPQYSFEYQLDMEHIGPLDTFSAGLWTTTPASALESVQHIRLEPDTSAGGQTYTASTSSDDVMVEFIVQKVAPGHIVAVGLFPVGGPPFTTEAAFGGWAGIPCYWQMNGEAGGYGDSGNVVDSFGPGDVIGVCYDASSTSVRFYLNGAFMFAYGSMNNSVRPFATVLPTGV